MPIIMPTLLHCDNCGEENFKKQMCHFEAIPYAVKSANVGESASICLPCFIKLEKEFHQKEKEMTTTKPYVYNENPNLLWGDETMFIINALKAYVEIQKDCIKKIEAKWKTPLNTLTYMDEFSEQIIGKLLHLQQPKEPGENNNVLN